MNRSPKAGQSLADRSENLTTILLNYEVVDPLRMSDPLAVPDGSYSDMMFGKDYLPPSLLYMEKI